MGEFTISLVPENPTIKSSETVDFTTSITGEPVGEVAYKWYVGGTEQEGETSSSFTFNPKDKVGEYNVKVTVTDSDDPPVTEEDIEVVTVLSEVFGIACLSCGVRTTFTDTIPNNDMIKRTSKGVYHCKSCGLKTGDFKETFRVE